MQTQSTLDKHRLYSCHLCKRSLTHLAHAWNRLDITAARKKLGRDAPTDNLVVAIYSYEPNHDGDLGFEKGEKLKIINK